MSSARFDVLGIGNAIVDVLARMDDDFLVREGLNKGAMALIDEERAETLYAHMGAAHVVSGGCAANTVAGVASFGSRGAFIGKVKEDELGHIFRHDITALGVHFGTASAAEGPATARSFILVTPDGERTMNTYLGACQNLTVEDIDPEVVAASKITYLEGYLWDPPAAKDAFRKASKIAKAAGRRVAITLSDSFCVDRYRPEFLELMRSGQVDTVFANHHELKALYETSDLASAVQAVRSDAALTVVTLGPDGCMVVEGAATVEVPAMELERIDDKTGAGDLFAAGFLHGLAQGLGHHRSAELGSLAAAEVISHIGARPERRLADLADEYGLTAKVA